MITFDPKIQEDFNRVIVYSQDYTITHDEINTTPIFDLWKINKEKIYHLMGDKLIYETDENIEFKLSEDKQRKMLHDFYDRLVCNFGLNQLVKFMGHQTLEAVYNNRVSNSYEYEEIKIPKDMKLSKAFKYFISDESELRLVQDLFSELVQKNKVSGKLCISIHPLDYLSTSETTYNWRSCHALDGEYRAGGLSYMCDATTVVCYIKGDKDVKLPRFPSSVPWNDKKWRMLLHMEEESQRLMIAGRQYPFDVEGAREKIKDIIDKFKEKYYRYHRPYNDHSFVNWTDDHFNSFVSPELSNPEEMKYTTKSYRYINGLISAMSTFVKTPKSQVLHYNDIILSHVYPFPHITWECNRSFGIVPKVRVGYDGVPCVCCGEKPIYNSESLSCRCCDDCYDTEEYYNCDYCGTRVHEEEIYYIEYDDSYICPNCHHEHYFVCTSCGYSTPRDESVYNRDVGGYICEHCNNEIQEQLANRESYTTTSAPTEEVVEIPLLNLNTPSEIAFTVDNARFNDELLGQMFNVATQPPSQRDINAERQIEEELRERIRNDIMNHWAEIPFN